LIDRKRICFLGHSVRFVGKKQVSSTYIL